MAAPLASRVVPRRVAPRGGLREDVLPHEGLALAAILVLALALRLWGLDAPLWYDEILTLETHLRLPWSEMLDAFSMNHHYLYSFAAKAAMAVFGEAAWSIRLPALVFGLGGILAAWGLARQVGGPGVALAVALLLALSYHHIWFSQNARGYTGLALWGTLGMMLFLRGLALPSWGAWLGFGATLALSVTTHLTGAFLYAALGLVWLWRLVAGQPPRGAMRRALILRPLVGAGLGLAVSAALYLPLLPGALATLGGVAGTSAVDVMQEYQNPLWTLAEAGRSLAGAGPLALVVGAAVIGLSILGGIAARPSAPGFAPAVLVHILLTVAVLLALGMRIWPRFFFADAAFLMLLVVLGVRSLSAWLPGLAAPRWFLVATVAMAVISAGLAAKNYRAPKQDLAGAFALAEAGRRPGERIYAAGVAAKVFTGHFGADWQAIASDADYRAAVAEPGPLTVVVAFPARTFRAIPALAADRDGLLVERRWLPGTLGDGGVVVLGRD